jgi:hypothetical protein
MHCVAASSGKNRVHALMCACIQTFRAEPGGSI